MERIIQVTADGSNTLSIPVMEVSYHSKHGAIQESMHIFIHAGLYDDRIKNLPQINILEIGFGTGLNTVLTAIEANKIQKQITFTSIEAFPLSKEEWSQLNYGAILNQQPLFDAIHEAKWNQKVKINANFQLHKINKKVEEIINSLIHDELSHRRWRFEKTCHPVRLGGVEGAYNLIYFDAFAPAAQPELWSAEIFSYLYSLLTHNGILVTYCSKGVVRRAMESVGFTIEKIPGPPGKREMVRALKM
ncbi:MAG: tRNA (5-methylaminomethyl-2-thiouridine)(34)-methyltransferase MnmD [Chitinophagaceae bacterium]|nr:tRNA (5-methylaminomethyl-2-thiouridine)(34)-methyltransferase MnmD [Chitinophagaceae bacterium]